MAGKHTSGPWVAFEIAPDDPSWGACEIWPAAASAERESDDSTARPVATMVCGVENARLIAAAPELLEACEAMIALRNSTEMTYEDAYYAMFKSEGRVAWEKLSAAIARATQLLPQQSEESK